MDLTLPKVECVLCGHKWIIRKEQLPKWCPKCRNYSWSEEFRKSMKTKKKEPITPPQK